jgi:hypothetical protein
VSQRKKNLILFIPLLLLVLSCLKLIKENISDFDHQCGNKINKPLNHHKVAAIYKISYVLLTAVQLLRQNVLASFCTDQ